MIPEPFTLERPAVDWERHGRDERPKILPPPGVEWRSASGKTKQRHRFYTRTTTLAKTLEDSFAIAQWRIGRVLVGIGQRPDYQLAAASLTLEDHDRDAREKLGEACIEASGPSAAIIGTALHTFTERIDRGEPLGFVPEAYRPLVEAWRRITAPLRLEYREVRTVHDVLGAAGTPDAFGFCSLPDPDGVVDERRVIDLKSGSIKYPATMSAQLFTYADSDLYDPETGERRPLEVNRRWGLIVHLKSDGSEPPGLYWINLEHGRRCVELAVPVREWRAVKPDEILRPALVEAVALDAPDPDAALVDITDALAYPAGSVAEAADDDQWAHVQASLERVDEPPATPAELEAAPDLCGWACSLPVGHVEPCEGAIPPDPITAAIERCVADRELELLWKTDGHLWTDEHRALAARRHTELVEERNLERPRAALVAALKVASGLELRALWIEHGVGPGSMWTDEHTAVAAARHAELSSDVA